MEEILASIRRILNEDEPASVPGGDSSQEPPPNDDVLVLDRSMLVDTPEPDTGHSQATQPEANKAHPTDLSPDWSEADETEAAHLAGEPDVAHLPSIADLATEPPTQAAAPPEAPFASPVAASSEPSQSGSPPLFGHNLVAPETAAATASSVDGLIRTLAASRTTQVYRGGPTIEDLVREELRLLLKKWLDEYLPPLVERLVRTEIERVVGRTVP
jgi:cell pole-organizing protein PopZ